MRILGDVAVEFLSGSILERLHRRNLVAGLDAAEAKFVIRDLSDRVGPVGHLGEVHVLVEGCEEGIVHFLTDLESLQADAGSYHGPEVGGLRAQTGLHGLQHQAVEVWMTPTLAVVALQLLEVLFVLTFLQFYQLTHQQLHRHIAVLMLRALVLARNDYVRRKMRDPDSRVRLVDVLAARSARAVGIDPDVLRIDLDRVVLFDLRRDVYRSERRVTSSRRIERRDPHQSVDSLLLFQIAVSIRSADKHRSAVDAGFLVVLPVCNGHLVALSLGPSAVHAVEHLSPVLRLRAAAAAVHLDDGVVLVVLACQEGLDLEVCGFLDVLFVSLVGFLYHRLVGFLFSQLYQNGKILELRLESLEFSKAVLLLFLFLEDFLGILLVSPESGILALLRKLRDPRFQPVGIDRAPDLLETVGQILHFVFYLI